jgi:predicted secreted protein
MASCPSPVSDCHLSGLDQPRCTGDEPGELARCPQAGGSAGDFRLLAERWGRQWRTSVDVIVQKREVEPGIDAALRARLADGGIGRAATRRLIVSDGGIALT